MSYKIEYTTEDAIGLTPAAWNVAKLGTPSEGAIKEHVGLLNEAYDGKVSVISARIVRSSDSNERAKWTDMNWICRKKCEKRAERVKNRGRRAGSLLGALRISPFGS